MHRLGRLIRPRSIAVIGGREAATVVRQCDRIGFEGEIWPIHPQRGSVEGRPCFRTLAELPGAPDAAFIGVNRTLAISMVRALSGMGCGGAVVYASGFAETSGDGPLLQAELVAAAGDMPMLGPNCYGFINALDSVLLWPDQHGCRPVERGVAIVMQSSNMAINLSMQARGLPIAYVATVGNQAQTTLAELAAAFLQDPRVTAVGLHMEGFGDVPQLERLAAMAHAQKKPVVAMKLGYTEQARVVTLSHTASVAGSNQASDALLNRFGIPRIRSLPAFLETLKLLHVHGALPGASIASMSCSGGEASLIADAARGRAVAFRPIPQPHAAKLRATLSDFVTISNPLDYHTFIWTKVPEMTAAFSALLQAGFDLTLLILDFPRRDRCDDTDWNATFEAMIAAARNTGARVGLVSTLGENLPEDRAVALVRMGIVPFSGIEEALEAIEAAASIGLHFGADLPAPLRHPLSTEGRSVVPDEHEAKSLLAQYGVVVPPGLRVDEGEAAAAAAANDIGFPVAVKALGIAHKTEQRAVYLGLADAAAVRGAAMALRGRGTGLLVESMVEESLAELIVGIVREPQIGLLLTVGAGGVLVEILQDTASVLLPTTAAAVRSLLDGLKIAPLLQGFRNRPAADMDRLVETIMAVTRFAEAHADRLEELDINPLIVTADGAVAADALIRMRELH
jgi:acyl-CoA synthetase (NDP forming)